MADLARSTMAGTGVEECTAARAGEASGGTGTLEPVPVLGRGSGKVASHVDGAGSLLPLAAIGRADV